MAAPGRLAALPGYDTAPDVYETPELTDDTSTTQRPSEEEEAEEDDSASASTSATTDSEDNSESESGVVSRRRLRPSHARERFTREGKGVEVKGGRFGDRVGGLGGRGYRVGVVPRRDEKEGLAERVARLRREVEECRVLAEREGGGGGVGEGEMEGLKRVLEGLETSKGRESRVQENGVESDRASEETGKGLAEFDVRLSVLEKSLGLSSLDGGAPEAPLLPSLALLDRQFGALMTASSITSLEAASGRIKKLKEEAEQLSSTTATITADSPAKPQQNGTSTPDSETAQSGLSAADVEKLRSLHNLLPTLQSLSPTVPALLDRLRSLHTLHAGAANAASELEDLERRQDDFEKELTEWREGLDRVEKAVREADEANGRNGKVVRGWVEDVEGRMSKLG